jgi:hypothetical protein
VCSSDLSIYPFLKIGSMVLKAQFLSFECKIAFDFLIAQQLVLPSSSSIISITS